MNERGMFVGMALTLLSMPVLAQVPEAVATIEAELSAYEAHVEALEAVPAVAGSERAVRVEIDALSRQLAALQADRAATGSVIAQAQAAFAQQVQMATSSWERAEVVPAPEPIIPSIVTNDVLPRDVQSANETVLDTVVIAPDPEPDGRQDASEDNSAAQNEVVVTVTPDPGPVTPSVPIAQEVMPAIAALEPMRVDGLSRRVLTLPDAQLVAAGALQTNPIEVLPTFTVLYVFDETERSDGTIWLAVGERTDTPRGWMRASSTEDWKSMLVMRFANAGDRSRALFFEGRDALESLAYDSELDPARVDMAYARAELGQATEGIVSIEPAISVDADTQPYFMPITAFERFYFEEAGIDALMLELASINANSSTDRAAMQTAATSQGGLLTAREVVDESTLADFRVGVAFVIDTTRSMGPYIERAQDFVLSIEDRLAGMNLADQFDFALVGYRDNTTAAQDIGYVTRLYRDFGAGGDAAALRANVMQMQAASASTRNWREDAFAGLQDAILQLSWSEVDTRIVFLITDASPRNLGDELARDRRLGPESILAMADQNNIALMVLHMQTEDARRISLQTENYDDHEAGQALYRRLQGTGIGTLATYFQVRGDSAAAFEKTLDGIAGEVADALGALAGGGTIAQPELEDPFLAALMANPSGVTIDENAGERQVAAAVVSELFRYQQEFLGQRAGVEAPDFHRAWTIDRDLLNPNVRMLDVYSFMSRENLGDLYSELYAIVEALDAQESGVGDFFENARVQSGQATVDPAIIELLPEYIRGLPYRSFFMQINRTQWDAMPFLQKEENLARIRDKLNAYRLIFETEAGWLRLSNREGSEEVYPLPLDLLP